MIDGKTLKNAIISGAERIRKHVEEVNRLNVFPVSDADTGTNLSLTMTGCAKIIAEFPEMGAGELADKVSGILFRCARGNSGVIFSMIFKGFAESIKDLEVIDSKSLATALQAACDEAYSSVEKPIEGTMLTVIRLAASKAKSAASKGYSEQETFAAALSGAKESLKSTPNLLPELKRHGVVDAGGQGLVYIMEGMLYGNSKETSDTETKPTRKVFVQDSIQFAYCTEFLINNPKNYDLKTLKRYFSDIGDCSAVAEHSGIIKIHVHTNSPDKALAKGVEIGELTDIKIDNMRYQAAAL